MTLNIERLKKAINIDSPKGLRRLLSEYIRISCLIEKQRSSLLDIRLEINEITNINFVSPPPQVKIAVRCKNPFKTRSRSMTQTESKLVIPKTLFETETVSKKALRRPRSHSAKAAYL